MDEPAAIGSTGGRDLLVWTFASFHAALLVALVVGGLYAAGVVGDVLADLDTWIGVLAFLYVWGVTWWTNRALLEAVCGSLVLEPMTPSELLPAATKRGRVTGVLVVLPVLVVAVVFFVGAGGLGAVPFLVLASAIGLVASVVVGAVVGGVFGLLDLLLLSAARTWLSGDALEPVPSEP